MDYWLTYWYMFPIVGAPTLSPAEAVGVSLITEVFGFSSGVLAYWCQRAIDLGTARFLLMFTMPLAVVGGVLSYQVPGQILLIVFSAALLVFAFLLYRHNLLVDLRALINEVRTNPSKCLRFSIF